MSKTVASTFGTFDEEQLKILKSGLKELSDVFTMQESQKEVVKEIVGNLNEELKIPKKIISKLARTYHKRNYSEVVAEQEEFELLFEGITEENT
jgi:Transcriptional regulator DsbA